MNVRAFHLITPHSFVVNICKNGEMPSKTKPLSCEHFTLRDDWLSLMIQWIFSFI